MDSVADALETLQNGFEHLVEMWREEDAARAARPFGRWQQRSPEHDDGAGGEGSGSGEARGKPPH